MALLICGRPDLGEEYLCKLVDPGQHGHAGRINPIVRVLAVLRYPIQHAIYWPDVASENAPVLGGCVCRLTFLRTLPPPGVQRHQGRLRGGPAQIRLWEKSAQASRQAYAQRCGSEAEQAILARHANGVYRARRSLRTYKKYELSAHKRAWEALYD